MSAPIMALEGINDAKHWRDRAAEMRALSDDIKNLDAQRMMLKLANDYDKLANRAEDRAARDKRAHLARERKDA